MNALDQAFIKAFAKDRTPGDTATRRTTEVHAQSQPPAAGVESVSLVLHDLYQQGKRLRIDRPTEDNMGLDAHMIVPLVEHVESYHPDDVVRAQPPVVFEDRLTPLDPVDPVDDVPAQFLQSGGRHLENRRQLVVDDRQVIEPESNVAQRTEAIVDKEVPTLDLPAAPTAVETLGPVAGQERAKNRERAEEQLLAQCQPQVLLAVPQLVTPGLMTLELGQLGQVATPAMESATSAIEISLPHVDLAALAVLASQPQTVEIEREEVLQKSVHHDEVNQANQAEVASAVAVEPELVATEPPVAAEFVSHAVECVTTARWSAVPEEAPITADKPQLTPMAYTKTVDPTACSFTAELPPETPRYDEPMGDGSEPFAPTATAEEFAAVAEPTVADVVPTPPQPFTPAWEVDAFRWPVLCQQLDERTAGRLTESGAELYVATQDGLKVLAITSSCRLEGRSTVALSLARTAAKAGSRVALVDADAANPELARRLGMEAPCDWCEVVRRGEPLSEAAVASLEDGVTLFPRTLPTEDETHLSDQSLSQTLRELGGHFDLVVVDLPPETPSEIPAGDGVPCCVDMAVVVRNVRTTSQQQCLATVTALRKQGVRAVGVIENFTHAEDTM